MQKNNFNSLNIKRTQINLFSQTIAPRDFPCFQLNKYQSRGNFLETFNPNGQFKPMKVAPSNLFATEMRFCKFSVVSVFLNWLIAQKESPETPEIFKSLKKFFCLFQVLKDFNCICKKK